MMAKCGQSAGKVITKLGVAVWKARAGLGRGLLWRWGGQELSPEFGFRVLGFTQGYACEATEEELAKFLDYEPRSMCPDDWLFVQSLIYAKNCFVLPKRRCTNRTPYKTVEPVPFPRSLLA